MDFAPSLPSLRSRKSLGQELLERLRDRLRVLLLGHVAASLDDELPCRRWQRGLEASCVPHGDPAVVAAPDDECGSRHSPNDVAERSEGPEPSRPEERPQSLGGARALERREIFV